MITNHKNKKELLFEGQESEIRSKLVDLSNYIKGFEPIRFENFISHNLEDLERHISGDDYKSILESGHFKTDEGFLNLPKGSDGLRVYYYKKANTVFVFAYGEFQPTRYKLYLEGIWTLDQ